MNGDFDEDEYDEDEYESYGGCSRCNGKGVIVICFDDQCRGAGECIHGDGEMVCPDCGGG